MPGTEPLDVLPLWVLCTLLFVANLLLSEGGFRVGRLRARRASKEGDVAVETSVSAELLLLAFLLAFSFGIVASRFDHRRQIVLEEANAVGTTFLRAATLPVAQGEAVRRLLRDYVDVRLGGTTGGPIDHILRRSEAIHAQLWTEAVAAAAQDPRSVPIGLFIQSLNELIDLHSTRLMFALRSRLPPPVWIVLFTVGLLSFFTMGYQAGLTRSRSPSAIVVAFTFGAAIWLVADLDRPGEGFLRVSQVPLIEVRQMMGKP